MILFFKMVFYRVVISFWKLVKSIRDFFISVIEVFYLRDDNKAPNTVNPEHVEACRRLIKTGKCGEGTFCGNAVESRKVVYQREGACECPGPLVNNNWACHKSVKSAQEWLASHGIKE